MTVPMQGLMQTIAPTFKSYSGQIGNYQGYSVDKKTLDWVNRYYQQKPVAGWDIYYPISKEKRVEVSTNYEIDIPGKWMRDWLGNEITVGDTIIMPARQGSSGAEHILYRVEDFTEGKSTYYNRGGVIKAKPLARSRYGYASATDRSVHLYILANVTKVNVNRVDI